MSSFTYTQLLAELQSWPEDDDATYVAAIPRIISLGETQLLRDLNLELLDITDRGLLLVAGDREVAKPVGAIETRHVHAVTAAGVRFLLERRSQAYCETYAPDDLVTGVPKYFCDLDEVQWLIVPAANADYNIEAKVVLRPDGLSATTSSTWLGDNMGDLLFHCCLANAEHYLKADDRYADMMSHYAQVLLPGALREMRMSIRNGDYTPMRAAAKPVE